MSRFKFSETAFDKPRKVDWERFTFVNLASWRAYNPTAPNLYTFDAVIKRVNEKATLLGRGLNAQEVNETWEEILLKRPLDPNPIT